MALKLVNYKSLDNLVLELIYNKPQYIEAKYFSFYKVIVRFNV